MNINNLGCSRVLYFFEEISKIPHGSGNEKQISDYLVEFAKNRELVVHQDEALNVIIKKPGTLGYEDSPIIILQGHMDMVCEKNNDTVHDFEKDPIKIIYDDDFIRADGTTLGADDGIAVAMGLALLDSQNIPHPPLEVVFTTNEEVGMDGANFLDGNLFDGKILINIDSEDEGIFTSGCAGGMKSTSTFKIEFEEQDSILNSYEVIINGLNGGHSGIDINKERANSNKLIARVLNEVKNKFSIKINSICGGSKDNAIPREAQAVISFDKELFEDISLYIKEIEELFKHEYHNSDKNINISIYTTEKQNKCFTDSFSSKLISVIMLMPNGIQSMSTDIAGLVESSNNLGVITMNKEEINLTCAVRSAAISKKYLIFEQIKLITELGGGIAYYKGDYPSWEFKSKSRIRDIFVKLYKEMYGTEPVIDIIHAGLECGLFSKKITDIDMISFGPNLSDIHTPNERISISSIERTWEFFLNVLKNLK